jgi:hypothetical protein
MQNFFFDRRSRKRNRRADEASPEPQLAAGAPLPDEASLRDEAPQPDEERRQQTDRRQSGRSTLEHYYAVHDMDVDELADLDEAAKPAPRQRPRGN